MYGEPLVWQGQVFVGTENDTVYALSASTGTIDWWVHLATPAPAGDLPCGDISPTNGITSTMVVDPATGMLFASAETATGTGGVGHELYALDTGTHGVAWSRDIDQPGWLAADQLQRAGLALDDGEVVVGFGGNDGDCGHYHGWVVGVPESGTGPTLAYQVPTANQGAVWSPPGPSVDAAGDLFVATGNGSARPGQPFDHGDAVIELSRTLAELQYFAPTDWAEDNASDGDLGSGTPVELDGGDLFELGKQATAYLLDAGHLGGIGGQLASLPVCFSIGADAYQDPDVFVPCVQSGQLAEIRVGPGATLGRGWTWTSPGGGVGSPTLAYGSLWTVDEGTAVLYRVDPASGTTTGAFGLDVGTPEHFASVSAAGGLLVVAGSRAVEAFRVPI